MRPETIVSNDCGARDTVAIFIHNMLMYVAFNEVGYVLERYHVWDMHPNVLVEDLEEFGVIHNPEEIRESCQELRC